MSWPQPYQDALLSCTHCSRKWDEGHGTILCPSCDGGYVKFTKYWRGGVVKEASLFCTHCNSAWSEGAGAIACPNCDDGLVFFSIVRQGHHFSHATLSCTSCSSWWNPGAGSIHCPDCRSGHVRFQVDEHDAWLWCTSRKCGRSWDVGHGAIACPSCSEGYVRFEKFYAGGRVVDASLECTSCSSRWNEGYGHICSPCCDQGFVNFQIKREGAELLDASLTCTDCNAFWNEGYGAIPCPACHDGWVIFEKLKNIAHIDSVPKSRCKNKQGLRAQSEHTVSSLDPSEIRYCQDSIGRRFRCGRYIEDTKNELSAGRLDVSFIPTIQVFEDNGLIFCANNRRLWCFKMAGLASVPVRWVLKSSIGKSKFTTKNEGVDIRLR